jgi:hypothetical protein
VQSHEGMLSDCHACHNTISSSGTGPHGTHEFGNNWAQGSPDHIGKSGAACDACHGPDERGTILSKSQTDQTLTTSVFGSKPLFRGAIVGCFLCHSGSGDLTPTPWSGATAANITTNTTSGKTITFKLAVADGNGLLTTPGFMVRVITPPANGMVGITNWSQTNWAAIYTSDPGFVGTNTFTFAAWNTYVDSALYSGTVVVTQGVFALFAKAQVPPTIPATWVTPFAVVATPSNIVGTLSYDWDFGDGAAHRTNQYTSHSYTTAGVFGWKVISQVTAPTGTARVTNSGSLTVTAPMSVSAVASGGNLILSWPQPNGDALLKKPHS